MSYETPKDNEWINPTQTNYKMACCDCGLVHNIDFRINNNKAEFRVRRNNRSTAMIRRHMGWTLHKDGIWRAKGERK